jgi:cytochrome c oxidase subunit III
MQLDVSGLPYSGEDYRSPTWWGNLLMLMIETTMFALAIAGYFYIRMNFGQWPPPQSNRLAFIHNPVPDLFFPTLNLLILLVSCIPAALADKAARRIDQRRITLLLFICLFFGIASIVFRFSEFYSLNFRWDDNAYASIVWTLLGLHLMHLSILSGETIVMLIWLVARPLDHKHAIDVSVTAFYWYWVVGIYLILYAIIYWGPRLT